jgi:signal peptidase I
MMSDDQSMRDRAVTEAGGEGWRGGGADAPGADAAGPGVTAAGPASQDGDAAVGRADPDSRPAADDDDTDSGAAGRAKDKRRSFWRELPVLVVVALVIALVIKSFVVQAFFIPSSSMENTLKIGDKVLVNKLVYHFRKIEPGDIIVFDGAGSWDPVPPPAKPSHDVVVRLYDATLLPLFRSVAGLFGTVPGQTDFIKRVIGVPGDHVACCNAHGLVTVNGVALHEKSYLYPGAAPSLDRFSITVPPGRLWVMGDNRFVSDDSRLHRSDPGNGTIPENMVIGRAFLIVWPPSRWRVLPIPSTFLQRGVDHPAGAAASAASAALTLGVPVAPSSSLPSLAIGLAGAVPLTWLQRRIRLRASRRRQRHR